MTQPDDQKKRNRRGDRLKISPAFLERMKELRKQLSEKEFEQTTGVRARTLATWDADSWVGVSALLRVTDRLKQTPEQLGLPEATCKSLALRRVKSLAQPTASEEGPFSEMKVKIWPRQRLEEAGKDPLLQVADAVAFLAMTYDSLRKAIARGLHFERLREAHLFIYALPVLSERHPLFPPDKYDRLEAEWKDGVRGALEGLLAKAPLLDLLKVTLLSSEPILTASTITQRLKNGDHTSIRCNFIARGQEINETPTLFLSDGPDGHDPLFGLFQRLIDDVTKRDTPLLFVLHDRVLKFTYAPHVLEDFVAQLSQISNHPAFHPKDRRFRVSLRIGPTPDRVADARFEPDQVGKLYNQRQNKTSGSWFCLEGTNFSTNTAVLAVGVPGDEAKVIEITGHHILACFALVTPPAVQGRYDILLLDHYKHPWRLDVPGGKVADCDNDLHLALKRELFEELGLRVDTARMTQPLACKYDPSSVKEGGSPVIALYYHYPLSPEEWYYLTEVVRNDTKHAALKAKGGLVFCALSELLKKSDDGPALCHAPRGALEALLERLKAADGPASRETGSQGNRESARLSLPGLSQPTPQKARPLVKEGGDGK